MNMLPENTVARKLLMAFTGWLMIIFVVVHALGNSTMYFSGLNAYAAALRVFPPFLWAVRLVMLAAVVVHGSVGIALFIENRRAQSRPSVMKQNLASTFTGRNMIWTGAAIAGFLVYHLLHFTLQMVDPASAAVNNPDSSGRPDVFLMVVRAFEQTGVSAFYVAGTAALLLHLGHGIQSSFQTWGLNSERAFPYIRRGGLLAAIALFLAYASIPVAIIAGLLE